eukprot:Skav201860  [mRNA]  locus=scaffold3490:105050:110023:- [translate_table: standard]
MVLPKAVKKEATMTVTPDVYSIFVTGLPRRLADDQHLRYEELLRSHFERQLNAEILPGMQMQGWQVISKEEQWKNEPTGSSCCGGSSLDYRGRRLGSCGAVEGSKAQVRWQGAHGLGQAEEMALDPATKQGLLQADLLKRLEEVGCEAPEGGRKAGKAVFKVSLIRDFKGKLGSMRKVVERAKKIGEQEETTEKEEGKLAEAEEALKDLDVEDCDVLGAFVTFTYIKFKDFVSQEYRFSRVFALGSYLQGPDQRFEGRALQIHGAPLPSDIFWENLDCPKRTRRWKTLLMSPLAELEG